MGHQCRRFEIQVFKYHPDGHRLVGSIGWDSGSCQVSGTLGVQYEQRGLKGKACGCVEVPGPIPLASGFELRIRFTFRENSRQ
jgi:hypothetical protein